MQVLIKNVMAILFIAALSACSDHGHEHDEHGGHENQEHHDSL